MSKQGKVVDMRAFGYAVQAMLDERAGANGGSGHRVVARSHSRVREENEGIREQALELLAQGRSQEEIDQFIEVQFARRAELNAAIAAGRESLKDREIALGRLALASAKKEALETETFRMRAEEAAAERAGWREPISLEAHHAYQRSGLTIGQWQARCLDELAAPAKLRERLDRERIDHALVV